jgi:hypothetical protein
MKRTKACLIACLLIVLAISSVVKGQTKGYPVDIPGTNVNFFLYRYTGDEVPYDEINMIWKNLSDVFVEWSAQGADPKALSPDDVTIKTVDDVVGIYLKGQLIVVVDEFHAKANYATRLQLAEKWAANLKKGVEVFVELNQPR